MKAIVIVLILACAVDADEPLIVFDNRPEMGIPTEARLQERENLTSTLPKRDGMTKLHDITDGTIKKVRIRYFNKETWQTEDQVREYVRGYLADKSMTVYGIPIWSQTVATPEIECVIEYSDDELQKRIEQGKPFQKEGRLLIWHTESCLRDDMGRWCFVPAFEYFHRFHPHGDRRLVNAAIAPPDSKIDSSIPCGIPFDAFTSDAPVDGEVFQFVSTNSGRCLSVKDRAVVQGPFPSAAGPTERWKAVLVGDYYKLVNEKSGKALAVPASSRHQGIQLIEWKDSEIDDQRWQFVKIGNHYSIKSKMSGFVVAVAHGATEENSRVIQWKMANIPDQIWLVQWIPGAGKK